MGLTALRLARFGRPVKDPVKQVIAGVTGGIDDILRRSVSGHTGQPGTPSRETRRQNVHHHCNASRLSRGSSRPTERLTMYSARISVLRPRRYPAPNCHRRMS
jgi:hypothetical protein